jgi:hypothetical protein
MYGNHWLHAHLGAHAVGVGVKHVGFDIRLIAERNGAGACGWAVNEGGVPRSWCHEGVEG